MELFEPTGLSSEIQISILTTPDCTKVNQGCLLLKTNLPKIAGECNRLHIGEVTAIYEEDTPVHTSIPQPHTELDTKAAGFVAERICDGATLQIGVGRVPDAIGPLLRDHRNLGVHTELFSQSLMELMKAGVINNSKKTLLPGKAVFSFAGGQLDFVRGARWSKGGKSFIVINSTTEGKDGNRLSKIDVALPLGSAVTTPRADVDCIVTEYGVAELRFKSLSERAHALIAIAHPEFRDDLTRKAKAAGYFI